MTESDPTEAVTEGREVTLRDVLEGLAAQVPAEMPNAERVQILRQSDTLYMCRVYPGEEEDFEGIVLSL